MFGAFGLAFWYGAQRYRSGAISNAGVVIVVLMSVLMILMSLERIATPLIAVSKAMGAACELFTIIDTPVPASGSLKPDISSEDLVFNDVTFEYPTRPGVKALDSISFCIRNGQNTALVGSSGSGKSTIVSLLEQWYSIDDQHSVPQGPNRKLSEGSKGKKKDQASESEQKEHAVESLTRGSITVGKYNLWEVDLKWWRSQVGLVQQEPFLFNDTIFSNVANGLIGTPWMGESEALKQELVHKACQEAYADEFINRLPNVSSGIIPLAGGYADLN